MIEGESRRMSTLGDRGHSFGTRSGLRAGFAPFSPKALEKPQAGQSTLIGQSMGASPVRCRIGACGGG